jgi:sodium/potassium-transporting ATPase subunit alpha
LSVNSENISSAEFLQSAHKIPLTDLLQQLGCDENGLSNAEADRRIRELGPNILTGKKKTPEILKFLLQFRNYFAILLIIGGCLALLAEQLDPGVGHLYIAYALFGVVVLNAVFTYIQERQSERIMESFSRMLPQMVTVLRDDKPERTGAEHVVPGDVMLLYEGDRICADGRLLEQNQMKIELSSLTGESEPELRHIDATHENILESRNMVFSGTMVQSGDGKALVYGTGMHTQIGRIVQLTRETQQVETPIRKELKYFIRIISFIAMFLGILFFAVSVAIGKGQIASLIFAIGIIVANVPEGLLPTVTLALTMASKRMARKNALIKNLESVETLGSTTVICTDKTGTITQNRIHVSTIILNGNEFTAWDPQVRREQGIRRAWEIMTLCNNATLSANGCHGDPTELALLQFAENLVQQSSGMDYKRVKEFPFDSATKRMITVNRSGDGHGFIALLKGAPEVVLEKSDRLSYNGTEQPLEEAQRQAVLRDYRRLAMRGERVLALAWRQLEGDELEGESSFVFLGLTGMIDPPRPEVMDAINRCRMAGIRVIMITGDYGLTAESIGRQIGLLRGEGCIVRGDELRAMNDAQLREVLAVPELIFARTTPEQKLRLVRALQGMGEVVSVTGDGVNDAPALKNADMGVAMGIMGTDVAKEASNMILMDDNFATIVAAVEEGRTIFDNIKKFIAYILTSNVPEILPFIAYVVLDIPLPLTVVLILAIDLGTDLLPALGLGMERPEMDVMKRPPRSRGERLLTRNLLMISYGIVGMIQAAAGFFSYFAVLFAGGWSWGRDLASTDLLYRTAITAFFASIIICQIADVIICRTRHQSVFAVGFLSNRLVLFGIAVELLLLCCISYLPICNEFFGTAPLHLWQLLLSVPFAVLILVADEIRRIFVRRENEFILKYLTW